MTQSIGFPSTLQVGSLVDGEWVEEAMIIQVQRTTMERMTAKIAPTDEPGLRK